MQDTKITDSIIYIGANDKTLDLFESQYIIPNGVSYNSYLIKSSVKENTITELEELADEILD